MKFTPISIFIGLLLPLSSVQAADKVKWKQVYDGSDYQLSINPKSIVREPDRVVVVDTKVRNFDIPSIRMEIDYLLIRARFDCKVDGRFQFIATQVVSTGEEGTYGMPTDTRWWVFASDRPEAIMGRATCEQAEKRRK